MNIEKSHFISQLLRDFGARCKANNVVIGFDQKHMILFDKDEIDETTELDFLLLTNFNFDKYNQCRYKSSFDDVMKDFEVINNSMEYHIYISKQTDLMYKLLEKNLSKDSPEGKELLRINKMIENYDNK